MIAVQALTPEDAEPRGTFDVLATSLPPIECEASRANLDEISLET
jgi:hypothetical protein